MKIKFIILPVLMFANYLLLQKNVVIFGFTLTAVSIYFGISVGKNKIQKVGEERAISPIQVAK